MTSRRTPSRSRSAARPASASIVAALAVVGIGLFPALTQSILDWTMAARSLIGSA
ncbi:MAG: hypothetical protein U0869_02800 [Chloroflexota bacterium]